MVKVNLKLSILFLFILFITIIPAQEKVSVIPYEVTAGKMIIKMNINGEEENFIFDTGASRTTLEGSYIREHKLVINDSALIKDINSIQQIYDVYNIESLATLDNSFSFSNVGALKVPEPSMFSCYDVAGIVGSDVLQDLICIIDTKLKTITLTDSKAVPKESLRYSHSFVSEGVVPTFMMQINGQFVSVIYDTGSSSFISIKKSDSDNLLQREAIDILNTGYGTLSVGVSGVILVDTIYRVLLPNVRIGPVNIKRAISETSNVPLTLVGTRMMEYVKTVIDYPRRRIYMIPYSDEPIEYIVRYPNFGITVKNGSLAIGHIWEEYSDIIEPNDIITHVNGEPAGTYDMCDIVKGIKIVSGLEPKTLTVKRKDGSIVEVIYKIEDRNL